MFINAHMNEVLRVTETQTSINDEATTYAAAVLVPARKSAASHVPSDALLIAQICQHHEAALGVLYDRYNRLLYSIALRITGDRSVAEEVIQDVFKAVWQSAGGFHPEGDVKSWLVSIARHRAIDTTRARNVHAQNDAVTLDDVRSTSTASETEPQLISLFDREQIRQALSDLPSEQRNVIELAYYAGYSCAQIATRTGVPLETVKTRLRIGVSTLRSLLLADTSTR
jgi:RNA polymerase sigma-70 factor (ECF subfamily)